MVRSTRVRHCCSSLSMASHSRAWRTTSSCSATDTCSSVSPLGGCRRGRSVMYTLRVDGRSDACSQECKKEGRKHSER